MRSVIALLLALLCGSASAKLVFYRSYPDRCATPTESAWSAAPLPTSYRGIDESGAFRHVMPETVKPRFAFTQATSAAFHVEVRLFPCIASETWSLVDNDLDGIPNGADPSVNGSPVIGPKGQLTERQVSIFMGRFYIERRIQTLLADPQNPYSKVLSRSYLCRGTRVPPVVSSASDFYDELRLSSSLGSAIEVKPDNEAPTVWDCPDGASMSWTLALSGDLEPDSGNFAPLDFEGTGLLVGAFVYPRYDGDPKPLRCARFGSPLPIVYDNGLFTGATRSADDHAVRSVGIACNGSQQLVGARFNTLITQQFGSAYAYLPDNQVCEAWGSWCLDRPWAVYPYAFPDSAFPLPGGGSAGVCGGYRWPKYGTFESVTKAAWTSLKKTTLGSVLSGLGKSSPGSCPTWQLPEVMGLTGVSIDAQCSDTMNGVFAVVQAVVLGLATWVGLLWCLDKKVDLHD